MIEDNYIIIELSLIIPILIILLCLILLSWFAGSDAPFIPTKNGVIKKILLAALVKKNTVFYELGSGDGRVVIEAAKLGASANGVEQSWIRVWYARYLAKKIGLKKVNFYHGDVFQRNYYPADVIYIYLLTKAVLRLEGKLKQELQKNAVVITQTYHFKNWKPYKTIDSFRFYRV